MTRRNIVMTLLSLLTAFHTASAATYYISPTGNDAYNGLSQRKALATIGAVQKIVQPGDVVYILPGTYSVSEDEISAEESSGPYKIVYSLSKSGISGNPISYIGVSDDDGKRPVFDFSAVQPEGYRVTGFLISANFLILKNFEIVGIKVGDNINAGTPDAFNGQSENIRITNGSYNTFENIACHDGWGIGFYLTRRSGYNLFVNCDGYNNYDPISHVDLDPENGYSPVEGAMGTGGDNDAFGCHVMEGFPGNIFIGCRAWNNADDGFDLINCYSPVTFSYCIAYKNGYDADNKSRGDGNGFKAGGYGMSSARTMPASGVPMHEVGHSIAASNKSNGIYSNHHLGGVYFHDNTSYRNGRYNYCLVNRRGPAAEDAVDVNGYGHRVQHNLSMVSDGKSNHITDLRGDEGDNIITGNSFYWVDKNSGGWAYTAYGNSIFESTKVADLTAERLRDGLLSEKTLAVMHQKTYQGLGCQLEGYENAIAQARKNSGAEADISPTRLSEEVKVNGEEYAVTTWCDLQGRKLTGEPHTKGIYIKNRKKVIIR